MTIPLLAILVGVISFTGVDAFAETTEPIYDPVVTQYIEELIAQPGKTTEERIIDEQNMSVATKVKQVTDDRYVVKSVTRINDEKVSSQIFRIITNGDGTYELINHKLEMRETFTDVPQGAIGSGYGSSTPNNARIDLYDSDYGTPHTLTLYDNYSDCVNLNQAVFEAPVRPNTVDVTWEASPYYLHWCFIPHEFRHGSVQYGAETVYLDGHNDRRGSHAFTNFDVGTTWYSVEVDFEYGPW